MKEMTEQHMINAFGGESMANMRYLHFADQADKENFPACKAVKERFKSFD